MKKSTFRCLFLFLLTSASFVKTSKFCSTPDEWMGIYGDDDTAALNYRSTHVRWPGGVVKYLMNPSLTFNDTILVFSAFKEYHTKTCIRFVPKTDSDINYVSIQFESDSDICGKAHVCMRGGYQYVKFGRDCRNKQTIIHELGHAICLEHEHQRADRDKYVTVDDTCNEFSHAKQSKRRSVRGFYDYSSQMHYACGDCVNATSKDVVGCGEQITPGLSVLDADYINELYNCSGCHRHRWVQKHLYDETTMQLGMTVCDNVRCEPSLVPCRFEIAGYLFLGDYLKDSQTCTTFFKDKLYTWDENFEIFYIPNNVDSAHNFTYSWIQINTLIMSDEEIENAFNHAVLGGHFPDLDISRFANGYIGYGKVPQIEATQHKDWIYTMWILSSKMKFPLYYRNILVKNALLPRDFQLLVCKPDYLIHSKKFNGDKICETSKPTPDLDVQPGLYLLLEEQQINDWFNREQVRGTTFCDCSSDPENVAGLLEHQRTCLQTRVSECKAGSEYQLRKLGTLIDLVRFLFDVESQIDDVTEWFQDTLVPLIPVNVNANKAMVGSVLESYSHQILYSVEEKWDDEWLGTNNLLNFQITCLEARSSGCKSVTPGKLQETGTEVLYLTADVFYIFNV